ncbi:hypothetical protein BVY04_05280, partial [bacterium M21]
MFDEAKHFSEGLAVVKIDGRYGYIDRMGTFVVPPQFLVANKFSDGLAVVRIGHDLWSSSFGAIDRNGKLLFEYNEFGSIGPFSEGLAVANSGEVNEAGEPLFG